MRGIPNIFWRMQKILLPNAVPSQKIYEAYIKKTVNPKSIWLDLGCGHQLFRSWKESHGIVEEKIIVDSCNKVFGLDYNLNSLKKHRTIKNTIRGNMTKLPFKNNSFDLITSNMVVEHLDNPKEQFKDIYRVLSDNGLFIFHTPNIFSYGTFLSRLIPSSLKNYIVRTLDEREESDVFKTYYRVNSKNKIFSIANEIGFSIKDFSYITEPVARFAKFPFVALFELLLIKILTLNCFKQYRTNIICTLEK